MLDPGAIALPQGASGNQASVAAGINTAVENGATPPAAFDTLLNMSGAQVTSAVDQLSGQSAGGAALAGTQMTTAFLTLLLNPFGGAPAGGMGGALGYAPGFGAGEKALPPESAAAHAAVTPKDKHVSAPFNHRWSFWGGGFGGANWTGGDTAAGSADIRARTYGFAAGAENRAAADLLVGFALAGGGTSWSLAQGLGGPRPITRLLSQAAELRLTNRVSIGLRFDGEFAASSQTYAGTGTLLYTW